MKPNALVLLASVLALSAPACTAIVGNTDGFQRAQEPLICDDDPDRADAIFEFLDMNAHIANLFVSDLVRIEDVGGVRTRQLVARSVYDPLGAADLDVVIPCSVVDGNHEVDVWADLNNNRMYDRAPVDHQWRLMLQGDGTLSYRHDVDFEDIADAAPLPRGALPFRPVFRNMDAFAGYRIRIEVRRVTPERRDVVVLVYDREAIEGDVVAVPVPFYFEGLIELRQQYEVAIWIDTNDDGAYQAPSDSVEGRDYATVITGIGEPPAMVDPGGLQVVFDGSSPPGAVDVRFDLFP